MTPAQLSAQIKAIQQQLQAGKVKNRYAAQAKIRQLQKELNEMNRLKAWADYLSQ